MCALEFPDLETSIWQTFKDQGVVVLGLRGGPGSADVSIVEQFISQTGITFPVAFDAASYNQFRSVGGAGLSPFPLDVIVGPDGRVAYLSRQYSPTQMQTVIQGLLGSSAGGAP